MKQTELLFRRNIDKNVLCFTLFYLRNSVDEIFCSFFSHSTRCWAKFIDKFYTALAIVASGLEVDERNGFVRCRQNSRPKYQHEQVDISGSNFRGLFSFKEAADVERKS